MRHKTCSQNPEVNLSKVQTHNFDTSFLKTAKLEMEQSSSKGTPGNGLSIIDFNNNETAGVSAIL